MTETPQERASADPSGRATPVAPSAGTGAGAGGPQHGEATSPRPTASPATSAKAAGSVEEARRGLGSGPEAARPAAEAVTETVPEVIDDFIRNFLVRQSMIRTLDAFETEWYDLKEAGQLPFPDTPDAPDVYVQNASLCDRINELVRERDEAKAFAERATTAWDGFRKERDFHRMHHKRVGQEKRQLIKEIQCMRDAYEKYEPALKTLQKKYEAAMREKMLVSLERDKLAQKLEQLACYTSTVKTGPTAASASTTTAQATTAQAPASPDATSKSQAPSDQEPVHAPASPPTTVQQPAPDTKQRSGSPDRLPRARANRPATLPAQPRKNPFQDLTFEPLDCTGASASGSWQAHDSGCAHLALHPRKPVMATTADDGTWRLWHMPAGDLIICGDGHKDWLSGVDFHPTGTYLATCSGDCTVRLWDLRRQACTLTLRDHTAPVWSVAFHDLGEFAASGSLDHSIRVWDLRAGCCKLALRGHADSVNEVQWQQFTNTLVSASADKTISLWDCRSGLTTSTLYGHKNSINSICCSLDNARIASCDADGHVRVWDARMLTEVASAEINKHGLNAVRFDRSGTVVAVGSDDARVYTVHADSGELLATLCGHDGAVQSVAFDVNGQYLVSCAADHKVIVWM